MQNLRVVEKIAYEPRRTPAQSPVESISPAISPDAPPFWRRALAEAIDRMIPLPFVIVGYFFPMWLAVVFTWHLLRDSGPERRSAGKMLCRLRVAPVIGRRRCAIWRSALRRAGSALSQTAYCMPDLMLYAFIYDLVSLAFVLLDPAGRRLEDLIAGTRVVTEADHRSWRQHR
jgi:uncharacterized RDD family membrane protein YckC